MFGEYNIYPRRSLSGLGAIDMAKKYPHTDTQCFPVCPKLTHENRPVRPPPSPSVPPTPPLPPSVFTKLKESKDTSWRDVASSPSDDNRGSASEKVYELCLIELDTKLSQG